MVILGICFIYCFATVSENGVEQDIDVTMLKECALALGWPSTYSNEGGYSCYDME